VRASAAAYVEEDTYSLVIVEGRPTFQLNPKVMISRMSSTRAATLVQAWARAVADREKLRQAHLAARVVQAAMTRALVLRGRRARKQAKRARSAAARELKRTEEAEEAELISQAIVEAESLTVIRRWISDIARRTQEHPEATSDELAERQAHYLCSMLKSSGSPEQVRAGAKLEEILTEAERPGVRGPDECQVLLRSIPMAQDICDRFSSHYAMKVDLECYFSRAEMHTVRMLGGQRGVAAVLNGPRTRLGAPGEGAGAKGAADPFTEWLCTKCGIFNQAYDDEAVVCAECGHTKERAAAPGASAQASAATRIQAVWRGNLGRDLVAYIRHLSKRASKNARTPAPTLPAPLSTDHRELLKAAALTERARAARGPTRNARTAGNGSDERSAGEDSEGASGGEDESSDGENDEGAAWGGPSRGEGTILTAPLEVAAQMCAMAREGKTQELRQVADHRGTYAQQQRSEVNIVGALWAKGGRVVAGEEYQYNSDALGPAAMSMYQGWIDGEQLLELEVLYSRDGQVANVQTLDEIVDLIRQAHGQLGEDEVLVIAVLIVGWKASGERYMHRTVLLLDREDGLYYDPTSLIRRRHSATQSQGFIPYIMRAMAGLVKLNATRGEADVTRQGQSTSDSGLCNLLSATAVAAAAFAGVVGVLPVLRCLQGMGADALIDVAKHGLPMVWALASSEQEAEVTPEGKLLPHSEFHPAVYAR
jgi:hypothetical protein